MGRHRQRWSIGLLGLVGVMALCGAKPTLAAGTASMPSLQQQCKAAALTAPRVIEKIPGTPYWGTVMADAGKPTQTVGVTLEVKEAMPSACHKAFQKIGIGSVYLSPSKHRQRSGMHRIGFSEIVNYGGNGAGQRRNAIKQQEGDRHDDYRCGDSVWLKLDSKLKSLRTHRIVARIVRWHQIPVLNPDGSNAAC